MLLAGKLVGLLALCDGLVGVTWMVVYLLNLGDWTTVATQAPLFVDNGKLMHFLEVMFTCYLVAGLLQLTASCSNSRILWSLGLLVKIFLFASSIAIGYYVWRNEMRNEEFLERQMVGLFQLYNKSKPVSRLLDWVHTTYECCGYYSDHHEWPELIGPGRVPDSCCQTVSGAKPKPGCGVNNQTAWLSRLHNAACHLVMWNKYEEYDPLALLLYWILVYLMWLGVLLNFYKVFLASYLAVEVSKYLRCMDAIADS